MSGSWRDWPAEAKRRLLEQLQEATPCPLGPFRSDPARLFLASGRTPDPWQAGILRGDNRQILLLCSRQAGKSTTAATLAIRSALLEAPALVLLLSPTLRQSGELFRDKVKRLYADLGRPVKVAQESALTLELANGSRIVSLPGDEETIRGYSGVRLLVIDEAARIPDELYRSVRPMLAVSGGRLVALSTPFGKQGWFYEAWHSAGDWERVRISADQCPRISPAFLEEERRAMGDAWYRQEYLTEFVDAGGSPLFPTDWLEHAARLAEGLRGKKRQAEAIGIDPGEGQAETAMAAVDRYGLIELASKRTPDTSVITSECLAFMRRHNVPAEMVVFDQGGGGKQHADRLRSMGHNVRAVAFGEAVGMDPRRGAVGAADKLETRDARVAYKNRRSQLYGILRELLDPSGGGFAIPAECAELRRQLAPIPLVWDAEGRLELPPKNRKAGTTGAVRTLTELIGCSPDQADSVALAVYAMETRPVRRRAGVIT